MLSFAKPYTSIIIFPKCNHMKHDYRNNKIAQINKPHYVSQLHSIPPSYQMAIHIFYQLGSLMCLRTGFACNIKMFYIYKEQQLSTDWQAAYHQLSEIYLLLANSLRAAVDGELQLRSKIAQTRSENARLKSTPTTHSCPASHPSQSSSFHPPLQETLRQKTTKTKGKRHPRIKSKSSTEMDSIGSACIYECTYLDCGRVYSSAVSLNLHVKTKHNGGTKKEREACAKLIIEAQQRGDPLPEVGVTFPPNFVKEFKVTYEYMKKYNM